MKKITFTIALITLAAMAVFANGNSEEGTNTVFGGRGQYQSQAVVSENITTLTGTVNLVENGHMELTVGNEKYELVYPYRLQESINIKEGQEITVDGYLAKNLRYENDAETKNLILHSATIDGKTYNLNDVQNSFQGNGPMRGQQGSGMSQGRMSGQNNGSFRGRGRS